jgi:anti-sigma factor RsiW
MNECGHIREEFSGYLDGAVSGTAMREISQHLEKCPACADEFAEWRNAQALLSSLGPAKAPKDLGLRLRVALSHEAADSPQENLARWRIRWENTVRPLLLQFSAGLASTLLLIGSVSLLVGMFGSPPPVYADYDQPLGMASTPRFLYSSVEPAGAIGDRDNPIIVEAFVNREGRVYDYKVVSGTTDMRTSTQLENALLFSVFDPARTFGQPVPGMVVLSFSGVSVHG